MIVKFKRTHENAVIPKYAKKGDACFDLTAVSRNITFGYVEYDTGIAVEIPEGHVGLIFPRSSVTNKDLMLKNSVGVIDSSFRGSISFRFNMTGGYHSSMYSVGDRIGQMMIFPIPKIELQEVAELSDTERGEGGYGSTGN